MKAKIGFLKLNYHLLVQYHRELGHCTLGPLLDWRFPVCVAQPQLLTQTFVETNRREYRVHHRPFCVFLCFCTVNRMAALYIALIYVIMCQI